MAHILPFRGIRYNLERLGDLSAVIAPPYDVISPEQQQALHRRHPHNVVRLEFGVDAGGDDATRHRYTRAAAWWEQWQREGLLRRDEKPALYVYDQEFATPGGVRYTRRGIVAAVRLEDLSSGVVRPHERTLSGPKADRLNLMRATHANISPIFSLYDDEQNAVGKRLARSVAASPVEATGGDGVVHRLWRVDDDAPIAAAQQALADKPLFIADGHHRYETALAYRAELQKQGVCRPEDDHPANFVMMTLVNSHDPGLVVLPIHRLVQNVPAENLRALGQRLEDYFDTPPVPKAARGEAQRRAQALAAELMGRDALGVFGLYTPTDDIGAALLVLRPSGAVTRLLDPTRSAHFNQLDVTLAHAVIIEHLLGITEEQVAGGGFVGYTTDAAQALAAVDSGEAQLALFLRPTRIEQVQAVASAGDKMPQKSTYFYPKVWTGMVMRSLKGW